jgi:hypothetical protein
MSAYLHIIYNYDIFLACFYYEFLTKCSFISGYVLKYMLRVGCGQVSQNLPYFDLGVAYGTLSGRRAHYLACIQYVLVCVGYANNINYDIIEHVLLIV